MSWTEIWTPILAAAAGVVTLSKAAEILERLLGKRGLREELRAGREDLSRRLTSAEEEIGRLKEGQSVMFGALLGIARHLRTGESGTLARAEKEIEEYLTKAR